VDLPLVETGRDAGASLESLKSLESYACRKSPESSSRGWAITSPKRGNNRQDIIFTDDDRRFYIAILREQLAEHRVSLLAGCPSKSGSTPVAGPSEAGGWWSSSRRARRRASKRVVARKAVLTSRERSDRWMVIDVGAPGFAPLCTPRR